MTTSRPEALLHIRVQGKHKHRNTAGFAVSFFNLSFRTYLKRQVCWKKPEKERGKKSAHYHHHEVLLNRKKNFFKEHLNLIYHKYIVASSSSSPPPLSCNIYIRVTIDCMRVRARRLCTQN
jgi:hypothetical protein